MDRIAEHFEEAQPDIGGSPGVEAPGQIFEGIGGPAGLEKRKLALFSQGSQTCRPELVRRDHDVRNDVQCRRCRDGDVEPDLGGTRPDPHWKGSHNRARDRRLTQARQEAKQAHRKYIEEITLQVGKDSRDTLPRVQRGLRDSFTEVATEVQRSVSEALQSAQAAVKSDQEERTNTLKESHARLKAIQDLKVKASALAPDFVAGRGGMSKASPLVDRVRSLIQRAASTASNPDSKQRLQGLAQRLDEPLRVAIAGKVKAGKSTLLNALVGQELAPTDSE